MKQNKFYITTTLPYVNAKPHIGTALEFVLADSIARYQKSLGKEIYFNTGTDEHGVKIFKKAEEEKMKPQEYVDIYAKKFQDLAKALHLSEHNFIRTTDSHHKNAAQEFWKLCDTNGYIKKRKQKIKYCYGCELEKTDSELEKNKCPIHPNLDIEVIEEENYFFILSAFQKKLLSLYKKNKDFVLPDFRLHEIKNFVEDNLQDFSISRLKEKMPWGIPVPEDDTHVMYVWFDALVNYISAIGWPQDMKRFREYWPVVQVAGKDQLRPQIVMWQAMLMAAGIEPSRQILIHGFVTSGGQKMSKSLGNVVDPHDVITTFGADALRYYFVREIGMFNDGDFTKERFHEVYTSELANGIGNTFSRVVAMTEQYNTGVIPKKFLNKDIIKKKGYDFWNIYHELMKDYNIETAVKEIQKNLVGYLDKMISEKKPWEMMKEGKEKEVKELLYVGLEGYRHIAHALSPFLPETADTIFIQLGLDAKKEKAKSKKEREKWGGLQAGTTIHRGGLLFPRQ